MFRRKMSQRLIIPSRGSPTSGSGNAGAAAAGGWSPARDSAISVPRMGLPAKRGQAKPHHHQRARRDGMGIARRISGSRPRRGGVGGGGVGRRRDGGAARVLRALQHRIAMGRGFQQRHRRRPRMAGSTSAAASAGRSSPATTTSTTSSAKDAGRRAFLGPKAADAERISAISALSPDRIKSMAA